MKREAQQKNPFRSFVVSCPEKPERLDQFLIGHFPESSRKFWKENLTQLVRVNGRKVSAGYQLKEGDRIALLQPIFEQAPEVRPNPKLPLKILYKDRWLIAVDKPAGIPCHPLKMGELDTVANALVARFPEQGNFQDSPLEAGLLHRLDNETSGVLLFARNREGLEKFSTLNRQSKIEKFYLAWVEGQPDKKGKIRLPIAHHPQKKNRMCVALSAAEATKLKARLALTEYEKLENNENASLLSLKIHKGSRHQIRVHLKSLGHPIIGDKIYGKKSAEGPQRHLLHAQRVEFEHPFTGKKRVIVSPIPKDFNPSPRPSPTGGEGE